MAVAELAVVAVIYKYDVFTISSNTASVDNDDDDIYV